MSELICPFCGDELAMDYTGIMYCCNQNCGKSADWYGSKILWQELIRTRKALEIAVDKLKGIKAYYDDSYSDPHTLVNWHIVAQRLANDADDAIKAITEITSIEQKDVK